MIGPETVAGALIVALILGVTWWLERDSSRARRRHQREHAERRQRHGGQPPGRREVLNIDYGDPDRHGNQ